MPSECSSVSVLLLKSALIWHHIMQCDCAGCGMGHAVTLHRAWWHRSCINLMGLCRLWHLCMRRSTSLGLSCLTGSCWTLMTRSTCWISLLVCLLLVPPALPCPALICYRRYSADVLSCSQLHTDIAGVQHGRFNLHLMSQSSCFHPQMEHAPM